MLQYKYNSVRATKARFNHSFNNHSGKKIIIGIIIALCLVSVALYFLQLSLCWFVLSFAAPLAAIVYWDSRGLLYFPMHGNTDSVDGMVSGTILAGLPRVLNINSLAWAIAHGDTNKFIALRLGFEPDFVVKMAAEIPPDQLEAVWLDAVQIREELNLNNVSSGALTVAIVKNYPNHEKFLAGYKISFDDLVEVVRWREHMVTEAKRAKSERLTGGLARDWSFGYTPLLERFGRNISDEIAAHGGRTMSLQLASRMAIVERMINLLSSGAHRNVCMVGPNGAGKTSTVHDFAEVILKAGKGVPDALQYNQVILLDPTALLAAAPGKGELEDLLQRIFYEASNAHNIIVCLDNVQLFMKEGQGSIDITNILLPVISGNAVRMIFTMDEQSLLELEKTNAQLFGMMDRVNIPPADYRETLSSMEDRVIQLEHDYGVLFSFQALLTAWRLSERYDRNRVQPGASFSLLNAAGDYSEGGVITSRSVETALSETTGIRVGVAEDAEEKDKLLNMEKYLHERVVGQDAATSAVADALRRARAGVGNQKRPVGAFLFLGPTGVGKTELAKALAEAYYGGENRLIRVDMNQFTTEAQVADLTADPADNPTSLTAQVLKNPFSVVLLDEIEKAHPAVLAALLQVLDEGVLRDSKSKEVNFRDAILICTSNAGADKIRMAVAEGEKTLESYKDQFVDELIDSKQFLPEFLNRFDEIVLFAPLSQGELQAIIKIIMVGINKNLEPQKIRVDLTAEAVDKLTNLGYDPRLGARPLRRIIQKTVENHVATKVISGVADSGDVITIGPDEVNL